MLIFYIINYDILIGVVRNDGEMWQTHRRFAMQVLRDLGFGKKLQRIKLGKKQFFNRKY